MEMWEFALTPKPEAAVVRGRVEYQVVELGIDVDESFFFLQNLKRRG